MRNPSTFLILIPIVLAHVSAFGQQSQPKADGQLPNIILIVADDLGYGDLSCYGSEKCRTPNLDWIASQGIRFTDCSSGASVDSAARAALLTGCYPQRLSITGILNARSNFGLNPKTETIAELLKTKNYRTSFVGNWHLGCLPDLVPSNHGFDDSFFIAFSPEFALVSQTAQPNNPKSCAALPLRHNDELIDKDPDRDQLFARLTEHAFQWINQESDQPFFLMYQMHLPHIPLDLPQKYMGLTGRGQYPDTIYQIDEMIGRLDALLNSSPKLKNTILIFTSDNGPRVEFGTHGGDPAPFSNGKYTCFEGGYRVPCIVRWPGKIQSHQVCDQMITNMDWLPTIAHWTGAQRQELPIDGLNISALIDDPGNQKSPHEYFFYYRGWTLQAVRSGKWKMHLAHQYDKVLEPGNNGQKGKTEKASQPKSLFNLETDPAEAQNVSGDHPEIVKRLESLAELARQEFGDLETGAQGQSVRPHKKSEFAADSEEP